MSKLASFRRGVDDIGVQSACVMAALRLTSLQSTMNITYKGYDLSVRVNTPDYNVVKTTLQGEFDPLKKIVSPDFDGLVIDGGGYIGTAAIALSALFPRARVVTVEPASDNYELLMRNVAPFANITPVNAALSSRAGERIELFNPKLGAWGYSTAWSGDDAQDGAKEVVETVTIDEIRGMFPDLRLGVVKLDIEGSEIDLFTNADASLREADVVFAELHERHVPGCDAAFAAFSDGRRVENYGSEKFASIKA